MRRLWRSFANSFGLPIRAITYCITQSALIITQESKNQQSKPWKMAGIVSGPTAPTGILVSRHRALRPSIFLERKRTLFRRSVAGSPEAGCQYKRLGR
jgi:hypothetical protein